MNPLTILMTPPMFFLMSLFHLWIPHLPFNVQESEVCSPFSRKKKNRNHFFFRELLCHESHEISSFPQFSFPQVISILWYHLFRNKNIHRIFRLLQKILKATKWLDYDFGCVCKNQVNNHSLIKFSDAASWVLWILTGYDRMYSIWQGLARWKGFEYESRDGLNPLLFEDGFSQVQRGSSIFQWQ